MERKTQKLKPQYNCININLIIFLIFILMFSLGTMSYTKSLYAQSKKIKKSPRIIYKQKTNLDFEGLNLEGEFKSPGEFYFQHRAEEEFGTLVKRRPNFHREMLRDVILSN